MTQGLYDHLQAYNSFVGKIQGIAEGLPDCHGRERIVEALKVLDDKEKELEAAKAKEFGITREVVK